MTTKTLRKIVRIDEDKCDGCGACIIACAEGALEIIDGKARLISEKYCDGLGGCIGECLQGALIIEERESEEFDEEAVENHLQAGEQGSDTLPCGCPSTTVTQFERREVTETAPVDGVEQQSMLSHWPVQLALVPPSAPFLGQADLMLAADCVPFAYPDFHRDYLNGHALLVACPKLDDSVAHRERLTKILRQSTVKSLTVLHMEVPCCFGLVQLASQAVQMSGKDLPFREITIGVKGGSKS